MARPRTLAILSGPVAAAVLLAAAGCAGAIQETADAGAAAAEEGVPPGEGDDAVPDPVPDDGTDDRSPEEVDAGAAGGPDVDAGGAGARPGAPFDVEAFEQVGSSYAEFLQSAPGPCDGEQCTLSYDFVENAGYDTGCWVDDFVNDPPARPEGASRSDQFLQRGTAVTAVIGCAPGVDPADVDTLEEAFGESTDESASPAAEPSTEEPPPTDEETLPDEESPPTGDTETDEGTG